MKRSIACAVVVGLSLLGVVLVNGEALATTPGRNGRIAFGMDNGNGFQVYTVRRDGTHLRRLTNVDGDASRPDWAPGGRRIVFELDDPIADTAHIVIMRADGTHMRDLTTKQHSENLPAFTPDGRHIVFECGDCAGGNGVFIERTDGTHRRRLTTNPFPFEEDSNPEVSPDGRVITFVRHKVDAELQALFAINRDGTDLHRIVPYSLEVGIKHDWAPGGHQIVITPYADHPENQSPNVATISPNGSYLRILTPFTVGQSGALAGSYSPDGRWIVYRQENPEKGIFNLMKMHPDGTDRTLLRSMSFAPRSIDWGPRPRS